ncbi:LxmA leader domain family RiPP [Streptomyces sp. NPDC058239]
MSEIELAEGFDAYTDVAEMAAEGAPEEAPSILTVISVSVIGTIQWGC